MMLHWLESRGPGNRFVSFLLIIEVDAEGQAIALVMLMFIIIEEE
jgi:hypothetical protein